MCEPVRPAGFETLPTLRPPIHAVFPRGHPLDGGGPVRLRDCLACPVALPTEAYGVRHVLETALRDAPLELRPTV